MNNNECVSVKQYIEIIDYYPSIIKSKIPLVQIFLFGLYYFLMPFYIIYKRLTKGKPITDYFKKKKCDFIQGAEKTDASFFDFEGIEISLPKERVLNTENRYFYDNDAKEIIKNLVASGEFKHINKLSDNFIVKIKNVTMLSSEEIPSTRTIILSYPKLAMILYKIFKPII